MNRADNLGKYAKPGAPGKKKGAVSGRAKGLAVIDAVIGKAPNLRALREALQAKFDQSPTVFWKEFVVPLLPKEMQIDVNAMMNGRIDLRWDENASSDDSPAEDAPEAGEYLPSPGEV